VRTLPVICSLIGLLLLEAQRWLGGCRELGDGWMRAGLPRLSPDMAWSIGAKRLL